MKANKNLGQHFLVNRGVVEKIVFNVEQLVSDREHEWVFEIGPGPGAITDHLLEKGFKVYAFDLDSRMIEVLRQKHADKIARNQLKLKLCDASQPEFSKELLNYNCQTVCGNLPYNVGTEIVIQLFEEHPQVKNFCFMLQKEVVDRFLGRPQTKAYSPLSVRWAWGVELLTRFNVRPGSFKPSPEVESAVFSYRRKNTSYGVSPHQNFQRYQVYTKILKKAFSQRRKMLRRLLPQLADSPWGSLRAEQLTPDDFLILCQTIEAELSKEYS